MKIVKAIFTLLILLANLSCVGDESKTDECVSLEQLGRSEDKVVELKEWFRDSWTDKEFVGIFENSNYAYALAGGELFSHIRLDWGSFGIKKEFGSMSISQKRADSGFPIWISFGEVRSSVYLDMGSDSVLDKLAAKNQWLNLGDGVYLSCE